MLKPKHPNPGKRIPPKPTRAEIARVADTQSDRALRAERREIHLAAILVLLLRGTFFERLSFILAIAFKRTFVIPFEALHRVQGSQLHADARDGAFYIGADTQVSETEEKPDAQ